MVPLFTSQHVYEAVSPDRAVEAVRDAFVAYARGEWTMPPKVYVPAYPAGDFRAMPAHGGGFALLKWISSFPGNPSRGLPTVMGTVLLSDASCGRLLALLDAASLTALRTGAAAVLAAETLARKDAASVSVAADVVATVTPGKHVLFREGALRPGQHVSLMGADGPDKCEIAPAELARVEVFCDDWEQASHAGDLAHAVEAGLCSREHVTEIGSVLSGDAHWRRSSDDVTVFDSTGLAIQDLAIALAAFEAAHELDLPHVDLS